MATPPPPPGTNPYSQQPPAPYGPQGGNPYSVPGPPVPAPARRVSVKAIVRGIAGLVVIGFVVYGGYTVWFGGAATADAGDCLHAGNAAATGVISVGDPEFEIVDCGDTKAQFKVVSRQSGTDGTCDDPYRTYSQGGAGRDFTLCLEPVK
ncbi:LppU/SCO3897 family protein [Actinacidiphila sp. bgisy160]|uniref:LppU/SCO3897 family protein n=1 Tax=Actinacidiphila sp. bgisy160 TaxID=3413796 RepID=UPI003D764B91